MNAHECKSEISKKVWVCTFSPSKKAKEEGEKLSFRRNELKMAGFVKIFYICCPCVHANQNL